MAGTELLGACVVGAGVAPPEGTYVVVPPLGGAAAGPALPPAGAAVLVEDEGVPGAAGVAPVAAGAPAGASGEVTVAFAA